MNIIEKSIMEYTDQQYNKYGDKVKELQQSLDFDLKECKTNTEKVVRLDSLSRTCDILINKAKEDRDKNIISKIVNVIKFCIIALSLYSTVMKVIPEVTRSTWNNSTINNVLVYLVVFIVTAVIISVIAKVTIEIIKNLYEAKITEISLKKVVIESNYRQLSKENNIDSDIEKAVDEKTEEAEKTK